MIILTLRTDRPEAEIGLYDDMNKLDQIVWTAHRQLAETLHVKIDELLQSQSMTIHDVQMIACYIGPGSFTGLRIGLSVANAYAYSLQIPMVGCEGQDWLSECFAKLKAGKTNQQLTPAYGAEVHITQPKSIA